MSDKIAVIGAGGYVGSRFVERSQLAGDIDLVAIVRSHRSQGRLARYGACTVMADARDVSSLVPHLRGCRMAVNLALGDFGHVASEARAVHEACRRAEVPLLLHMSSAEVFGRADAPELTEKSTPPRRHWMQYARVKAAADAWLLAQPPDPLTTVIFRPGLVWGPGSRWLTSPAQSIFDGTAILLDGGRGICNLIHVDNLIEHVLHLNRSYHVGSGVFNVADAEMLCWRDYYEAIAHQMGVDPATISTQPDVGYRETLSSRLFRMSDTLPARALKRPIHESTRRRIKQSLRERIRPPLGQPQAYVPIPKMDKGTWWLQGTRRKLPSTFAASYPGLQLRGFNELMTAAGHWLRYAGYFKDPG